MTNNLIAENYQYREQALIKHYVLEKYLETLTAILSINTRHFEFTYIDCFAGPWQDDSASMGTTSIAISLQVLKRCKEAVEARGHIASIRALFVEKDNTAYPRLKKYLSENTPEGIKTDSIHGDFVESRGEILSRIGVEGFAFFFIDPKGWTPVKVQILSPLLKRPRSEFLINFMYNDVNRMVAMERLKLDAEQLLGESIDFENIESDRELTILNTYRKNLKKNIPIGNLKFPVRSAYVKILYPRNERTIYHLVYITTHPKGVIKFMDVCENSSLLQGEVRAKIREDKKKQQTGITDLFEDETPFVDNSESKINEPLIDQFWLDYIKTTRTVNEADFADILELKNWFPKELQASLGRLIASNKIINLDAPRPRRTRHLHYEENGGERLQVAVN